VKIYTLPAGSTINSLECARLHLPPGEPRPYLGEWLDVRLEDTGQIVRARVETVGPGHSVIIALDLERPAAAPVVVPGATPDPAALRELVDQLRVQAISGVSTTALAYYTAVGVEHAIAGHTGSYQDCEHCVGLVHARSAERQQANLAS
jgi:hypothetical protein